MNKNSSSLYRLELSGTISKIALVVFMTWLRAGSQEEVSQSSQFSDEDACNIAAVWLKMRMSNKS